MVLYFSGTGNSRYTAEKIAEKANDTLISLNERIREKNFDALHSEKPFVVVSPTYAWRMPHAVSDYLEKVTLNGSTSAYFVLTCGGDVGNAAQYAEKLCTEKGLNFMGLASVVMPENYIAMFSSPTEEEEIVILEKAHARTDEIAARIAEKQPLPTERATTAGKIMSGPVNSVFYKLFVKAKPFYATDACTECGKCAKVCPLSNITLSPKPQWGKNCTHCMACINRCPAGAIEYGNKSKGKRRYVHPGM